ncbi:MAG: diacylglycerol kinase family lipid kinase [Chloroflexi bacterium]|nr:diacylglycerol kinase family lipid kinase [Chloroflexota bacterium]
MKRSCVIVNPTAGKGAAKKVMPQIEALLQGLGLDYEIKYTDHPGHGIELAEEACNDDYATLVAVGGDGTVNEVINGMMRSDRQNERLPHLGVLPVGRGNDFSFGMGIPQDLESACRLLANGYSREIDVGFVKGGDYPDGRYFGNGIGIGFDTVVGFEAAKLPPFISGIPAYLVAALKTIFLFFDAPTIQLNIDGEILEQPCLLVSVMNGRRMGGSFMFAPDSKSDDGLFSLCIVEQVTRWQVLGLFPKVMSGTHESHPAIKIPMGKMIKISALSGTLPVHADGETICETGKSLEVDLFPRALRLVCP